jgi:hypothetical protein
MALPFEEAMNVSLSNSGKVMKRVQWDQLQFTEFVLVSLSLNPSYILSSS